MSLKKLKLDDVRLNKSGTIGTETIAKKNKNGKVKKYVELKFGKLGKIDIPKPSKKKEFNQSKFNAIRKKVFKLK